jgi:HEAT repeat protein
MTDQEKILLFEVNSGQLTTDEFYRKFPADIRKAKDYVVREIQDSIKQGDTEELDIAISLIWLSGTDELFIDILNQLLINPNHRSHQFVTRTIQELQSPTSVPFIKQVLESNFSYLTYTCSDSDAIAKWFSWALYEIGTKDAIKLMKEYSKSPDEGIRKEMIYRLKKV